MNFSRNWQWLKLRCSRWSQNRYQQFVRLCDRLKDPIFPLLKSLQNALIYLGETCLKLVKIPIHFLWVGVQLLLYINPFTPHRVNDENLEAYIVYLKLGRVRSFLKAQKHRTPAFLLLLFSLLILGFKIVPWAHVFEGNIIAESVSFTYAGPSQKLFINSIRNLQRLELEGVQNLHLLGLFEGEDLSGIDNLDIRLKYPHSKLIITSSNPDGFSQLELSYLRLQPQTEVRNFIYDTDRNQLIFTLIPPSEENSEENSKTVIQLSLGQDPLNISLEGYDLPQLNQPEEEYNFREFVWTPYTTELNLSPSSQTELYLDLPNLETSNYQQWLWGNLTVNQVRFSRLLTTDKTQDNIELSTILQGKVRMVNQDLNLEKRQFLIFNKTPNIQSFPRLQIHPDDPQGLQVRIHGQASKIAAGIDPQLSVSQIHASLLDLWLLPEIVNLLLTVAAVVIGYVIPWLFTN